MTLTHIGEVFLQDCAQLVNEYIRLKGKIQQLKETDFETLHITGFIDPAISAILRQVRRRLQALAPHIIIKYASSTYQTSFEILRRGESDLAIEPISTLIDIHDLDNIELLREPTIVIAERDSVFASLPEINDESFREAAFTSLRSNKDHAIRKHLQEMAKRRKLAGDIPKGLRLSTLDSYEELFIMGFDGMLLMLPESKAREYCAASEEEYVMIPFTGTENDYDFRLFFSTTPKPKVRVALDAFEQVLKQQE
jgi:DNA-binding transcriptional LysR family regulator